MLDVLLSGLEGEARQARTVLALLEVGLRPTCEYKEHQNKRHFRLVGFDGRLGAYGEEMIRWESWHSLKPSGDWYWSERLRWGRNCLR